MTSMDILIQLNKQAAGRDRIARLCQYMSKFLWYYLQNTQKYFDHNAVTNLKSLEYQLSTFRKLLRWGKCVDIIYTTLPLFNYPLDGRRFVDLLAKLSQAFYFFTDHILWLGRADLCEVNTSKWNQISNKYWLYTIVINLIKNFMELSNIFKLHSNQQNQSFTFALFNGLSRQSIKSNLHFCRFRDFLGLIEQYKLIFADFVKNVCDLFIPLTSLGYFKLSPGFVGLLGVFSSIAGIIVLIESTIKFVP